MTIQKLINKQDRLPAARIALAVNESLNKEASLVVTAPPGAGKSTFLPLTIQKALGGRILMLEPRRIAARQIAERMADILEEHVGQTVGYRIRFESKVSKDTRIEVITEGILTRMLVDDPFLEGVSAIIFDEFHERSIHSDLALALARQIQKVVCPDLKIIVMSATINTDEICRQLGASLIESEGRMYPVDIRYADHDTAPADITKTTLATILKAYREEEGDILAFLPGQAEIMRCEEILQGSVDDHTGIYPLYGNLTQEKQRQAIAPSRPGERKIVLATPIAETSITIEGVRIVVDAGYCRKLQFDARTGLSHLQTVRISQDMGTQRMGRAGRVAEGVCYRLWTQVGNHLMEEQRKPEIVEADLASLLLSVTAFGESDILQLEWLTPPPSASIYQASQLLESLGAIENHDGRRSITPLGEKMSALPCHPRMARMMLSAQTEEMKSLACDIAALLEEKDPLVGNEDTDLTLRVSMLRKARRDHVPGRWARITKISREYQRMVHTQEDNSETAPQNAGLLLAHAYPERIAKSANNLGLFRTASGANAKIESADINSAQQWIAIASMHSACSADGCGKIFLAAPIDISSIEDLTTRRENISWNSKEGRVVTAEEVRIGKLTLSSKPLQQVEKEKISSIICEAIKKDGLSMLDWNEDVQRLQRRVALVAAWHPELDIPDVSTPHLMETAGEWLPFYLEQNSHPITTCAEMKKLNLATILWNTLPYDLQQTIDRMAPTHIKVPSGSQIKVDYRQGKDVPVLSVRLQECFGMEKTPCVNDGLQPVLMELLSPGFKPVQLTQDLQSFWQGTYFEVRKDLKRRYPKHYWPENPLESEAVRGVKRK